MYENIKLIAEKYYGKAAIRVFPYISPELYANDQKHYLTELDLENSIGIATNNIEEIAGNLYRKLNISLILVKINSVIGMRIAEL